ncbi:MAG: LysE family translocator [Pseudomonadota bacterium]
MWEVLTSFDPALLSAFVAAGLLLNITPGADFIFITASGMSGGPKIGMSAALGVSLGVVLHILVAAAGASALLLAFPWAYDAIRYTGAAYLAYLAVQAWRQTDVLGDGPGASSVIRAVKRGFLTNVLNPKTALFIFAFIPQFTDPAIGPIGMQILMLGAIFSSVGLAFALSLGAAAGIMATSLKAKTKLLNRISALLFGGLAARLVFD